MLAENAEGVLAFLAIVFLVGWFLTSWQAFVVDVVRKRMFEVRDRVFLWAYDEGRLDDEAYIAFREIANASIRHFESMSLVKVFVLGKVFRLNESVPLNEVPFMNDDYLKSEFMQLIRACVAGTVARSVLLPLLPLFVPIAAVAYVLTSRQGTSRLKHSIAGLVGAELVVSAEA